MIARRSLLRRLLKPSRFPSARLAPSAEVEKRLGFEIVNRIVAGEVTPPSGKAELKCAEKQRLAARSPAEAVEYPDGLFWVIVIDPQAEASSMLMFSSATRAARTFSATGPHLPARDGRDPSHGPARTMQQRSAFSRLVNPAYRPSRKSIRYQIPVKNVARNDGSDDNAG